MKCKRCGRQLKDPTQSMGPVCRKKVSFVATVNLQDLESYSEFDGTEDVVCERRGNGIVTNVQHVWKSHSPTGFEWGYGGSGPADLALNILLKFGLSRDEAYRLHQDFKWKFVGALPREGGRIPAAAIRQFIASSREVAS